MKKLILLTAFACFTTLAALADPPVEEGKAIFSTRCASCHNMTKDLTGPALAGVHERRSMDWIVSFVKASQTMVKAGDKDAVAVFEKFNRIPMPDHPDLTEENIKNVVEYIKAEGANAATAEKPPFKKPSKLRAAYIPLSTSDWDVFLGYLAVVAILIAVMVMAVQMKMYERKTNGTDTEVD